jgi:hypothetical protein
MVVRRGPKTLVSFNNEVVPASGWSLLHLYIHVQQTAARVRDLECAAAGCTKRHADHEPAVAHDLPFLPLIPDHVSARRILYEGVDELPTAPSSPYDVPPSPRYESPSSDSESESPYDPSSPSYSPVSSDSNLPPGFRRYTMEDGCSLIIGTHPSRSPPSSDSEQDDEPPTPRKRRVGLAARKRRANA